MIAFPHPVFTSLPGCATWWHGCLPRGPAYELVVAEKGHGNVSGGRDAEGAPWPTSFPQGCSGLAVAYREIIVGEEGAAGIIPG